MWELNNSVFQAAVQNSAGLNFKN